jgi:hypothetical protein
MTDLPSCGLYRTTVDVEGVAAGRLVYFHNHGEPGPGVYSPARWTNNRAVFSARGTTLTPEAIATLEPLPPEGFYRVVESFLCCAKECRRFQPDELVQLGYDRAANAILFTPRLVASAVALPSRGTRVERDRLGKLARLRIPVSDTPRHETPEASGPLLH